MDRFWNDRKRARAGLSALLAAAAALAAGCATVQETNRANHPDTVALFGLARDFAGGDEAGHWTVDTLGLTGDHGVGGLAGGQGQLVMDQGLAWRIDGNGGIAAVSSNQAVTFAAITWLDPDRFYDLENMDRALFERAIELRRGTDRYPIAIRGDLLFDWIDLQAGPEGARRHERAQGELVGYFMPAGLEGLHPPGFHFCFLAADKSFGGYVRDFHLHSGRVTLDPSPELHVFLATNAPAFRFNPPAPGKPEKHRTRPPGPVLSGD